MLRGILRISYSGAHLAFFVSGGGDADMRGSVQKKGNRYYIVYYVGKRPIWRAAGSNKKAAERMLAEVVSQINRGEYRELKPITFAEFVDKWLVEYAEGAVRETTLSSYKSVIKRHLLTFF